MSIEEPPHVALPKLMGAPAYARPPRRVDDAPRPFDPDDLPIAVEQTDEERHLLQSLPARAYAPGGGVVIQGVSAGHGNGHPAQLEARPFGLKALAGRLLRGN